ncbi:hypothetical protein H0X90_21625 [Burkholderia sp. 9775_39]|uniref:hypothetical protein n=1 Tax=unclassified Burkholderia TaxID=2613784 RepID=UPI0018C3D2B3|nr:MULTISPECIES: hypothetical protein [unclassified Burkholderia]MBG0879393.1 hypothetical protein [Burkholderia sp. 9775_39]MBG0884534.1 hypothetical protein [Burkholderia sp. 9773_38]
MNLIESAIAKLGGLTAFTTALNAELKKPVTYQAVKKWVAKGRLPRTEWTGETDYSSAIEKITGKFVSKAALLQPMSTDSDPTPDGDTADRDGETNTSRVTAP